MTCAALLEHRIPPPVVAALVATAMWASSLAEPHWAWPQPARILATALLVVLGLGVEFLGVLAFRASRTTVNPLRPRRASALVTAGVYRMTRNPMYVGMACLLLAWAMYLSALWPFAGVAVFVAYITRFQIQPEERILGGLFGADYAAYCARVRRWL